MIRDATAKAKKEEGRIREELDRYGFSVRILEGYEAVYNLFFVRIDMFVGNEHYVSNFKKPAENGATIHPMEVVSMLRKFAKIITKVEKKKAAK